MSASFASTVVWFPSFQLFLVPVFLIGFAGVLFVDSLEQPDFILPLPDPERGAAADRGRPVLCRGAVGLDVDG